jgi:hypothetical protein
MRRGRLLDPAPALFHHLLCPRCATPLAIVGVTEAARLEQYALVITSAARTLSAPLQRYQPGATIPAYLKLRAADRSIDHVLLIWPEYQAALLTAEEFAEVGPALQALHRCLLLARLY